MDMQLSGRVALVTGASKGIGLATTRTFLEEGARVAPGGAPRSSTRWPGTTSSTFPRT